MLNTERPMFARPLTYKTFTILNSTEHENYAHKW